VTKEQAKLMFRLEERNDEWLTADDIAPLLEVNPHSIRLQAQADPNKLGFTVMVVESRVKIPRKAFIRYMKKEVLPT